MMIVAVLVMVLLMLTLHVIRNVVVLKYDV